MADDNNKDIGRLEEARLAMEDSEHRAKRAEEEKNLEKGRREARLAMEGYEHKVKRELEERRLRDEEIAKKLNAERLAAEQAKIQHEQELKAQAEKATEEEKNRQEENRLRELTRAEQTISKIKEQEGFSIEAMRTIKSDVVQSVEQSKIALTELAKPGGGREVVFGWGQTHNQKNYWLIGLGSLLVLLITLSVAFIILAERTAYESQPEKAVVQSIVFADFHESVNIFNLPPETVIQRIKTVKNKAVDPKKREALYNIYLISESPLVKDRSLIPEPISLDAMLKSTSLSMAKNLQQALLTPYMIGTYKAEPGSLFMVFKIKTYEAARGALLASENATISTLFAPLLDKAVGKTLLEKKFKDQTIKNVDSRILQNDSGNVAAIYAFPDKNTLIIASDEKTFTKVLTTYLNPKPSVQ